MLAAPKPAICRQLNPLCLGGAGNGAACDMIRNEMENSNGRSLTQKEAVLRNANKHFFGGNSRVELGKLEIKSARAASEANTLRLRTLRLAKEEADKQAT
jgi:hypothetical protein